WLWWRAHGTFFSQRSRARSRSYDGSALSRYGDEPSTIQRRWCARCNLRSACIRSKDTAWSGRALRCCLFRALRCKCASDREVCTAPAGTKDTTYGGGDGIFDRTGAAAVAFAIAADGRAGLFGFYYSSDWYLTWVSAVGDKDVAVNAQASSSTTPPT